MKHENPSPRLGGGKIFLCAFASILAALAVCAVLFFIGQSREKPSAQAEPGIAVASTLSVAPETALIENTVPAAAEALPVSEETDIGYTYDEIIAEEDGFLLARLLGKRYRGFIVVVDDPFRITVGTCGSFGGYGKTVKEMADAAGALLAVNGGGFEDEGGMGNGGTPIGNVVVDGELLWGGWGSTVALDKSGKLHTRNLTSAECLQMDLQWALSYGPTLIIDGVIQDGLRADLSEPRTAVGQREDGSIIIVTISGRQAATLGVTEYELAYIMRDLGAVNAGNLDGGASSYIYYQGEYLNISNTGGNPRGVPTSLLVMPKTEG